MFRIDTNLAKQRYRALAGRYDYATRRIEPIRRQTIEALRLRRGQRVLDVACGTGKSFEMLLDAVGPEGAVVGVEQSSDMMQQARERVREAGWQNVELIESPMENASLKQPVDAVLFVYTQDVLQSDAALRQIFAATKSGAQVASTGLKLFPWYLGIANVWLLAISYPYFTTFEGLKRPWDPLAPYIDSLQIRSTFMGSGYIAHGQRR